MRTLTRWDIQGGDDAGIFPEECVNGEWCCATEAHAAIAELEAELAAIKAQCVVMPEPMKRGDEGGSGEYGAAMIRGYNACLREVARLNAAPVQQPKCKTCDDNGRIGGPSFYAPDEGGDPCPDCCAPVQQVSVPDGWEASLNLALVLETERAIKQRDEFLKTGISTAALGGSHDTCFAAIVQRHIAMLAAAPAAPAADAWIPVSERLPNIAQEVIVHSEFDGVCAGVLDSYGEWFAPCSEYKLIRVTSWMPMPTKIEANRHD